MRFETFFEENYEAVRRSLAVAFGEPVMAEELAQDAFTRALASWRRVSQMERPAGWVYIVALRAGRRADLPLADVAEAMDCAVGTVKSTVHAALERLGVEMQEQEEPDAAR